MAISTTVITKAAGYAKTDLIYQLEEAFTWLGWQGDTVSGIVTGISAYSGGGTVGSSNTAYVDVFPATTSGIGTGASFYVQRQSGSIFGVYVNRPGVGYTDGEYVTLSAEDIGGSSNGATGIGITVFVAGGGSPVGYGTTTAFFDSQISGTYPWGVVRHTIESGKEFGDTYRAFQANSTTTIDVTHGSSFHPWDTTNTADKGNFYRNRFAGNTYFDLGLRSPTSSDLEFASSSLNNSPAAIKTLTVANSGSYDLDLTIYRSGIDPNFAVFSYRQPTLSSLAIDDNTFATFFFHNFTTSLWDLDYLFLGGLTSIEPIASPTNSPRIEFYTYLANDAETSRSAEWGYSGGGQYNLKTTLYHSSSYPQVTGNTQFYNRTADNSKGGFNQLETLNSNTFYNAVIKGIPLNKNIVPCPYYLPDDFVLIDFKYNTPSANIQQGDTVTISGSEVYTVITGSYNQTTTTRGILFCARTV